MKIKLFQSLVDFVYPPLCLHCKTWIEEEDRPYFCTLCQKDFFWIAPLERCRKCLEPLSEEKHVCFRCLNSSSCFHEVAAVFEYGGPVATLVKKMKYQKQAFLAGFAASFLAAQWARLDWPLPDIIIPVPLSWDRWLQRGFNQSALLAQGLAEQIGSLVVNGLRRSFGDFSQAGLSVEQRRNLSKKAFYLKKGCNFEGKTLLLIDDVYTTGTTLSRCAQALALQNPKAIYGLTLCASLLEGTFEKEPD